MSFNLHLKSLLNSPLKLSVKSVDGANALEKWVADNDVEHLATQDILLEEEIGLLEAELEKRKILKYGKEVHAMATAEPAQFDLASDSEV